MRHQDATKTGKDGDLYFADNFTGATFTQSILLKPNTTYTFSADMKAEDSVYSAIKELAKCALKVLKNLFKGFFG